MVAKRNELSFMNYLLKYLPTHSNLDEGLTFNLQQVRYMIEERIKFLEGKNGF